MTPKPIQPTVVSDADLTVLLLTANNACGLLDEIQRPIADALSRIGSRPDLLVGDFTPDELELIFKSLVYFIGQSLQSNTDEVPNIIDRLDQNNNRFPEGQICH